jgi:CRP-like cAMP-binding protein
MATAAQAARNHLLSLLPAAELELLLPSLDAVTLETRRVLWEPDEEIGYVHFPLDALISISAILEDGSATEVATIGSEGVSGIAAFLDTESLPFQGICLVGGEVLRMKAADLPGYLGAGRRLPRLMQCYIQTIFVQVGQSAVCNRMHPIDKRCARWLLQTHDRVGADEFNLTHEFLAEVLGVRRAGVSVAARELQQRGLIRYSRGRVTIVDRGGLEGASCECYRVVRNEYERLLGDEAFDT